MVSSTRVIKQKIGAVAGATAPLLAFTCILSAIASDSTFSWTNNALSDLGIVHGVTGPLFNFGLTVSGALGFVFAALGLFAYLGRRPIGKVGAAFFAAATIALIAIGVFNESFHGVHYAVSVAFFMLAPISLFIVTCAFALAHQRAMAGFTVAIGVVAAVPWLLLFAIHYVPDVAIPETISAVAVSTWVITLSYKMFKQPRN